MKLINREPTKEMVEAFDKAADMGSRDPGTFWTAMYDAAPEVKQEPVEIEWPEYHAEAMGCGLEDRMITDPYEAMRYGWDEALEYCAGRLPDRVFTYPPDAQAEIAKRDARIAELEEQLDIQTPKQALKEQAAEISRLKSELQDSHKRNYITHSLFETGDTDCPEQAKDRNGEVVLGVCKNCGRIEVDLAEPCDHREEISRLKAVIAKCHSALTQCKQWKEGVNTLTCHNHEAVELALAAIKEIEK